MPPKALKGFQKIRLAAGACGGVGFPITAADLQTWNVVTQKWELIAGTYALALGSSSRDIRVSSTLTVTN